ncbi:hypothetical protein D3C78_1852230 [compost metagenome]
MSAPADGLGQVQLLPARRLPIQHPFEAKMEAPSRPLIAMFSRHEDDATVAGQHGLQQRGRDGGGLIHQQQIRLQTPLYQPVW